MYTGDGGDVGIAVDVGLLPRRPVDVLIRHNEQTGTEPNYATCSARVKHDDAIPSERYARALQALQQPA
jgi:hypothetical protein